MGHEARYSVISPVKDEEAYIRHTAESMLSQRLKPLEWVIVDDGSRDRTPEIVEGYSSKHPWIRLVKLQGSERVRGGHIVRLFYEGYAALKAREFDYIVKLDADLSFGPNFFKKALGCMTKNPGLGITSGISHILKGETLVEEKSAEGHTLGACKIYRVKCLEGIGGLVEAMGWDGIDEIKARMRGWEAWPVPGLKVIHLRPEGRAKGLFRSGIERGRGSYFMGYHPAFFALRALKCLLRSPLDGLGMAAGYAGSLLGKKERIDDAEFIKELRASQVKRLFQRERA